MSLKVKLMKSVAGAPADQRAAVVGLGLRRMGQERLLKDTPQVRGMVFKVKHLVTHEVVSQAAPEAKRRKPRKIVQRDRARAAAKQA